MPFKKKDEKEKVTVDQKPKPVEKFYALYSSYHFSYPTVITNEKTGKVQEAIRTNPVTGNPVYDVNGQPKKVMILERFKPIRTKMSQGFLSEAVFDPNTDDPQKIARGEALRDLANQPDVYVLTEDQKDKNENLAAWLEKKKRKEMESRLEKAEATAARAEEPEKRINELEAGK